MIRTFSSCLLYTCETAYYSMVAAVKREHHLPGQCSLSAHWTAQTRRPSYKQVCSPHTMRVQAQGEQLHQAHVVIPCTVIYPHICASDSILLLWPVTTTTHRGPVYRRFAVFLYVRPHNSWWMRTLKQNSGSHEHLSQDTVNIYHNIVFWCECIIVGYTFWICVDVACAMHITIVTHKPTSEQIHHHCHTVLLH